MYPTKRFDDFDINEFYQCSDAAELASKIDKCVSYICNLRDAVRIINDRRSLKVMLFLRRNSVNNPELAKTLLNQNTAIEVIVSILNYYKNELKTFLNTYSTSSTHTESYERFYFHQFDFMNELLLMISNITNESKSFCYKFHDQKGTKSLLNYLDDIYLLRKLIKLKQKNVKTMYVDEIGYRLLLRIVQSVHNISVIADYRKKDFEDLKIISIIRNIVEHINAYEDARILAYITLTNVVNDAEIETLPDTKLALGTIVKLVRKAADCIVDDVNLVRIKIDIDIDEENEVLNEVVQLPNGWHIISLLIALYRLAVNDRIKYDIYDTHKIDVELGKILDKGNDTEKEYAAKLMWQLCFDKRIAKRLYKDEQLYSIITNLSEISLENRNLKHYCQGILWSVKKVIQYEEPASEATGYSFGDSNDHQNNENQALPNQISSLVRASMGPFLKVEAKYHIMISYNSQNRELCLKIKKQLEKLGHTVWIDVENISGSSLEAMAKAVENSKCVLMCMTEKYKLSPNCRAEAEYAFRLNVPIVPLIMQENGWMPDGWLGFILGSKIFVNFTKYSFDECMKRLINEINAIENLDYDEEAHVEADTPIQAHTEEHHVNVQIRNWSSLDVKDWLEKSGFHQDIANSLKDFNGELLIELNAIRHTAPDYFYKAISLHNSVDLFSVVSFVNQLEKIFA